MGTEFSTPIYWLLWRAWIFIFFLHLMLMMRVLQLLVKQHQLLPCISLRYQNWYLHLYTSSYNAQIHDWAIRGGITFNSKGKLFDNCSSFSPSSTTAGLGHNGDDCSFGKGMSSSSPRLLTATRLNGRLTTPTMQRMKNKLMLFMLKLCTDNPVPVEANLSYPRPLDPDPIHGTRGLQRRLEAERRRQIHYIVS